MMLDRILKFDSNWWDCLGRDPAIKRQCRRIA